MRKGFGKRVEDVVWVVFGVVVGFIVGYGGFIFGIFVMNVGSFGFVYGRGVVEVLFIL